MKPGVDYIGVTVVCLCHDGNGNFLYQRGTQKTRQDPTQWEFGGGKLEFGEVPRDGVLRELQEEFGCVGVIDEALEPYSFIRESNGEKSHWLIVPYIIRVEKSGVKNNEPESVSEICWSRLDSPPAPLFRGAQYLYDTYYEALKKYV